MPWELQVLPSDSSGSLGSIERVQAKLLAAVPKIEFGRDCGGLEKLAAMESRGVKVPDVIREHWLRSKGAHLGLYQGQNFTIDFHFGQDESAVVAIGIEVRGSGDPWPVIQRLMRIGGWKVLDLQGQPPTMESWKSFATWRDDAIQEMHDSGA